MSKQFTLGKDERLKSRKIIEQLFSDGKSFTIIPFKIFYLVSPYAIDQSPTDNSSLQFNLQFGIGASTKNFKKAVDRNGIKRLVREVYRLQKSELQKKLSDRKMKMNLFFIYIGKEICEYKDVYSKMNIILNKLDKIVDEIK
ncbi:MAG: ribonuclease P protein component [Bacteroidia bacterium]|nr:ribonuclease P protein component [Bacteroidia bacterium]